MASYTGMIGLLRDSATPIEDDPNLEGLRQLIVAREWEAVKRRLMEGVTEGWLGAGNAAKLAERYVPVDLQQ